MDKRGGKREGAGRPKGVSTKILERQSHAQRVVEQLGGDAAWIWTMNMAKKAKDYRTVVEIMRYWTDRAEGKAPQGVKLEAEDGVTFSVGAIAEERFRESQIDKSQRATPGKNPKAEGGSGSQSVE